MNLPQGLSTTEIQKPSIQTKLDHIEKVEASIDEVLQMIDAHLDRLTNRPPRQVNDKPVAGRSSVGDAPRPSVEGALNVHASRLESRLSDAQALLHRLQQAI